jgi:hypothetical protein
MSVIGNNETNFASIARIDGEPIATGDYSALDPSKPSEFLCGPDQAEIGFFIVSLVSTTTNPGIIRFAAEGVCMLKSDHGSLLMWVHKPGPSAPRMVALTVTA